MEVLCTSHRKLEGCRSSKEKRKAIVQSTQDQIDSHFELSGTVGSCTIRGEGTQETTFRHVYLRIGSGGSISTLISQLVQITHHSKMASSQTVFSLRVWSLYQKSQTALRDKGSFNTKCIFFCKISNYFKEVFFSEFFKTK